MQPFYCANCGTRLSIARKALPAYGKIIHIVEFHECSEEPIELDLTPVELPEFKTVEGKDRFIRHIDELIKPLPVNPELRDRRSAENVKTTAPMSVLDEIEALKT